MSQLLFIFFLSIWLVAAWTMIRMIVAALRAGERSVGRFLFGSFVLEPYNRKNLWVFVGCVAIGSMVVIVVNILWATGHIRL